MLERLDTLVAFATVMLGISLLITIINQMIASLLGHRATYLKDGIKDLLETLDPTLAPHVEKIANDVLTHKLASDSIFAHQSWAPLRWKLASTVRPEELSKLLNLISAGQPYAPEIHAILAQVNPTVAREIQLIANTANALAPASAATADQLLKQLSDKTTNVIGRLEAAFNSTMDRVRQRFTLQMRIWTIVFSLLFALAYHLNVVRIYSQLSSDPELRASLSDASKALIEKYPDLTGCSQGSAQASGNHSGGTQQPKGAQATVQDTSTPDERKEKLNCDVKSLAAAYKDVRAQISDSKLALFDSPKKWNEFEGWTDFFGMLAMAALLSLGAPFWYNALKSLVNLRSQVAERQQKEKQS